MLCTDVHVISQGSPGIFILEGGALFSSIRHTGQRTGRCFHMRLPLAGFGRSASNHHGICTSSYNATMPDSVYQGKAPVIPLADAPIDNDAFIRLLRGEKEANGGYIPVDTGSS